MDKKMDPKDEKMVVYKTVFDAVSYAFSVKDSVDEVIFPKFLRSALIIGHGKFPCLPIPMF